jgi:hypothetical protein
MFKHIKAQSSLEMVIALICVLILLLGSVKIFSWANNSMVLRQQEYDSTRVSAGSAGAGSGPVDDGDASVPALNAIPGQ